jgi:hypothetical protein
VNRLAAEVRPRYAKPPKIGVFTPTSPHGENHAEDNAPGIVPDADSLRSLENYALHALIV